MYIDLSAMLFSFYEAQKQEKKYDYTDYYYFYGENIVKSPPPPPKKKKKKKKFTKRFSCAMSKTNCLTARIAFEA